jgi:hypothetical protein
MLTAYDLRSFMSYSLSIEDKSSSTGGGHYWLTGARIMLESAAAKFLFRADIPEEDWAGLIEDWTKTNKVIRETMATRRPYSREIMIHVVEGRYD